MMTEEKRRELKQRQRRMQDILRLQGYFRLSLQPWIEVYRLLKERQVKFNVLYLVATMDNAPDLITEAAKAFTLNNEELLSYIIEGPELYVQGKVRDNFPSVNGFRYMPAMGQFSSDYQKTLLQAITELGITNQPVLFFYSTYYPVIQIDLFNVLRHADMLYDPMVDVIVLPLDYSWIIFKDLEDIWAWKYKSDAN
jgi:hypothetical protein